MFKIAIHSEKLLSIIPKAKKHILKSKEAMALRNIGYNH